ncbi:patatin-like phospholipase family protein, partial [Mycobacterium tuberculosis]|nr:patatin-like phospholipase family protein [Mycobacterium tuberculosis]
MSATNAARLFHVDDRGGGTDRLARILNGTSIGLALSGGGARAFAHVGVVRALREAGVTIDLVCGTSMGAIVGAG